MRWSKLNQPKHGHHIYCQMTQKIQYFIQRVIYKSGVQWLPTVKQDVKRDWAFNTQCLSCR